MCGTDVAHDAVPALGLSLPGKIVLPSSPLAWPGAAVSGRTSRVLCVHVLLLFMDTFSACTPELRALSH
eukprot:3757557-Rhodomonas_salina.1